MVDTLGILGDGGAAKLANDFKDALVVVHRVGEINRRVVKLVGVDEVALLQADDFLHQGVLEVELQRLVVCIEVSHYFEFFL